MLQYGIDNNIHFVSSDWTCVKDSAMRPYGKSSLGPFKLLAALAGHEPTDPLKLSEQAEPALDDFGGLCAKRLLTNEQSRSGCASTHRVS